MAEPRVGLLTQALGSICRYCPMCIHARAHPDSFLGRILHHPLHADHCPFWKAEKQVAKESGEEGR
jgi:hypothetical protein